MKISLLVISFFFTSLLAFCQFPNTQFLANNSTKVEIRGSVIADSGYIVPTFVDTNAANKGPWIKGIPGILIRTGNLLWIRNATASAWIQLASTSFYSFSNLLTESPAGTVKFGGLATTNTIANLNTFRLGIDSGNVVIMGKSNLSRSDTLFEVGTGDGNIYLRVSARDNIVYMDQFSGGGGIFLQTGAATNILNGGLLDFLSNGFMGSFQQKLRYVRQYPVTSDSTGIMLTNDTIAANHADSILYNPFVIKFRSTVDNLERNKFFINGAGKATFSAVNTAGGTTGDQTINEPSGTVNIAATGTSVVVTNRLCTTASIVLAVVRSNDGTAVIKNVVPGSGSFVIHLTAAATAETSIGFLVIN